MALGKQKHEQQEAWVATTDLPRSPGHPFYRKLNQLLAEAGFDSWLESLCGPYYAEQRGRPSIPPGTYFRMVLIGYFEGIASQRGIAWRCCDSRSLAEFLGYGPTQETPDHSSLTRIHQRLPQEVHEAMFTFVLALAAEKKLLAGTTVAVDSTMLEANAAMKSIERKDTGEDWKEYLRRLAAEAGIENPTDEDLRRFDKKRTDKKVSNDDWQSPSDPDSRIAKMKDGRTHLAYKAEHVVDLKTDLVLAAVVYEANRGDAETLAESVVQAQKNIIDADSPANIRDAVADKGYHSAETLALMNGPLGVRTYIPEPKRNRRWKWSERPSEQQAAVTGNGRRARDERGKRLQRLRSELTERSFAHVCKTGGARRCWLQGLTKVTKRYLLQVAARNLGLIMRELFGMGTPRGLQPERDASSLVYLIHALLATVWIVLQRATRVLQSRAIIALENRPWPPRLAHVA
jgi:transposase